MTPTTCCYNCRQSFKPTQTFADVTEWSRWVSSSPRYCAECATRFPKQRCCVVCGATILAASNREWRCQRHLDDWYRNDDETPPQRGRKLRKSGGHGYQGHDQWHEI